MHLNSTPQNNLTATACACAALLAAGCLLLSGCSTKPKPDTPILPPTKPPTQTPAPTVIPSPTPTATLTPTETPLPIPLPGIDRDADIEQVYAGRDSWAVRSDGTIWVWGLYYIWYDTIGQFSPALALGLPEVKAIFPKGEPVLGLTKQGEVWVWRMSDLDRLTAPDGFDLFFFEAARIAGLEDIITVSNGGSHRLAVDSNGDVWAWGNNDHGQLGNNTTENTEEPILIHDLDRISQVAASDLHSLALGEDGNVWQWGKHWCSRDEDGVEVDYYIDRLRPDRVDGLPVITSIAAGTLNYALDQDGDVWKWGTHCGNDTPDRLPNLDQIIAIDAGRTHLIALRSDGTVWAWGYNNAFGQLGSGELFEVYDTPNQVVGLVDVVQISAGDDHNLVLTSSGEVYAWGWNSNGLLGNPEVQENSSPIPVPVIWP